jgi:DNA-binding MarR family transcriptional regulator
VDHVRARSTPFRLSANDSLLLTHLDEDKPVSAGQLARHLGVAASTMSATIQRLEAQGYLRRTPQPGNRRRVELRLTPHGAQAMAATSALAERHIRAVLAQLPPARRKRAVAGLAQLGRAAVQYQLKKPARHASPT